MPRYDSSNLPPQSYLHACFSYDPDTGLLTWRTRPREHFATERAWKIRNTRFAGKLAGPGLHNGRLRVGVTFNGVNYRLKAHRVIWGLVHGCWPADEIDHRNGDGATNRLDNLREATRSQNEQNKASSPTRGTVFHALSGLYGARIKVNRKTISLGYYRTVEKAHARYLKAKAELHPFQPVPRD